MMLEQVHFARFMGKILIAIVLLFMFGCRPSCECALSASIIPENFQNSTLRPKLDRNLEAVSHILPCFEKIRYAMATRDRYEFVRINVSHRHCRNLHILIGTKSKEIGILMQHIDDVDISSCSAFGSLVSIFESTSTYLVLLKNPSPIQDHCLLYV